MSRLLLSFCVLFPMLLKNGGVLCFGDEDPYNSFVANLVRSVEILEVLTSTDNMICGGTGGWRRVFYLDMAHLQSTCPEGLSIHNHEISKKLCGRSNKNNNESACDPFTLYEYKNEDGPYSQVCGRIKAFQYGNAEGFKRFQENLELALNDPYVDGVSLTYNGDKYRKHIWTFAADTSKMSSKFTNAGASECNSNNAKRIPDYVKDAYFCDSGLQCGSVEIDTLHYSPLWDEDSCSGNGKHSAPYFVKRIEETETNIDARICMGEGSKDIAIELIELYVK